MLLAQLRSGHSNLLRACRHVIDSIPPCPKCGEDSWNFTDLLTYLSTNSLYNQPIRRAGKEVTLKERKKERILFTTAGLTNKIHTLADISMEGCRKARAIGASRP